MAHVSFIYIACSRQVPPRRLNQSAPEIVSISSGGLYLHCEYKNSLLGPRRTAGHGLQQCVGSLFRENARHQLWFSSFVCRTEHFTRHYQGVSHAKWPKDNNMSTRQPRPAASFATRSKRWTSSAARPEPKGSQNAQRNYERYLALARAEAQTGNTVGAENYYQHAEHYFRSMSSDPEAT